MSEIVIFLEDIDPVVFGANNSLLDKIQSFSRRSGYYQEAARLNVSEKKSEITLLQRNLMN